MNTVKLAEQLNARPDATVGVGVFHEHLGPLAGDSEHSTGIYAHLSRWLLEHLGAPTHEDDVPALISPIGYTAVLGQLMAEVDGGIDMQGARVEPPGSGVHDPRYSLEQKCDYLIGVSGAAAGRDFEAQVREEATILGMIAAPQQPAA